MESSLEKLKCLDYEDDFLVNTNNKPFGRVHFAIKGDNPSLQFQEFLDIVQWLTTVIKRDASFLSIDKYDDPNASVNKLMLALRNLNYPGEFPVNKIKQAYGEACCDVLNFLTDEALESRSFVFGAPKHNEPEEPEDAEPEGEADEDDIEDEVEIAEDDFNAGMFSDLHQNEADNLIDPANHQIIESKVDPIEWKTELERVGPRLRTSKNAGGKEWRTHIDQTTKHEGTIRKELPETEASLQMINKELADAVEKMQSKEKYVNSQFANLKNEFQSIKESMKDIESKFQGSSGNVSLLQNDLADISDELSEIKATMDSRGSSMTDTSPLVKIKAALQEIKSEIKDFELRIGVVGHTLLAGQVLIERRGDGDGDVDALEDDDDESL